MSHLKNIPERYKLPASISISVLFIILLSLLIFAVYEGRELPALTVTEAVSEISNYSDTSVYDVISSVSDVYLPEKYKTVKAQALKTSSCKRYTEYEIANSCGTVIVKNYINVNLIEDDQIKIPDDAKKIMKDHIEIFIFENKDGTSTAVYYNELSRCIITENCSASELENIFIKQP